MFRRSLSGWVLLGTELIRYRAGNCSAIESPRNHSTQDTRYGSGRYDRGPGKDALFAVYHRLGWIEEAALTVVGHSDIVPPLKPCARGAHSGKYSQ